VILADTSIWIDHLRAGHATLVGLLERGLVLGHPWVVGEVALGRLSRLMPLDERPDFVRRRDGGPRQGGQQASAGPLVEADGDAVAGLLADRVADVGLHRQPQDGVAGADELSGHHRPSATELVIRLTLSGRPASASAGSVTRRSRPAGVALYAYGVPDGPITVDTAR
jgi:predicted nucleic acid-binding protein